MTRKGVTQSLFLPFSPFLIFYRWCEYSILSQENSHGFHLKFFPKCQLKDTFFILKLWSTPTEPVQYGFRSGHYGDQVMCTVAFIEPKWLFLLILLSSLLLWAWAGCDDMILMSIRQVYNQTHRPKIRLPSIFSIYLFASVELLRPQSQWYVIWSWYLRWKHWCQF